MHQATSLQFMENIIFPHANMLYKLMMVKSETSEWSNFLAACAWISQENAIYFNNIIKEKFLSHRNVGEVRNIGLINAIELVKNKSTKEPFDSKLRTGYQIYKKALKKGVILRPLGDIIYFNPPLIIERKDMDYVTDVAFECMKEVLG